MNDSRDVYYVVLRSAGRHPLFEDEEDRRQFTRVAAEGAAACGVIVHAYCWLEREARLAIQPVDAPVSRFAQWIADNYTRRRKRRISLTGSQFEQRYRGVPVDGRTELPELVRHIHLAPLKAGLTDDLATYPWSSHLIYLGHAPAPWITVDTTLGLLAAGEMSARLTYAEFIQNGARDIDPLASSAPDRAAGDAQDKLRQD